MTNRNRSYRSADSRSHSKFRSNASRSSAHRSPKPSPSRISNSTRLHNLGSKRPQVTAHEDIKVESVEILYEDEALIAVNKPARLPMHANLDLQRDNLIAVLSRQLEERDGTPGYLGIHQRLDWGTSGVVIFTRSKAVNAAIAEQFAQHSLTKIYLALVGGKRCPAHSAWRVTVPLAEPLRKGGRMQLGGPHAVPAVTRFRTLQQRGDAAWVEARLETGRKHQIRAHLSADGRYIYGDDLYGQAQSPLCRGITRTMLHATDLILQHPLSGKTLHLHAGIPDDMQELAKRLGLTTTLPIRNS